MISRIMTEGLHDDESMTKPKPQRHDPTEQWEQLELLFTSPEQRIYEQIRPVVLFGVPPEERAQEIGAAARTLYRRVQRFAHYGMRSLFATEPTPPSLRIPSAIREAVVALKAEHAGLHFRRPGHAPDCHHPVTRGGLASQIDCGLLADDPANGAYDPQSLG